MTSSARLSDHWWLRPGWYPGRISLTWHLTFEGAGALHRHVQRYQEAVRELPGLDPVPVEWLHLTMQSVGYVDAVPDDVVPAVVEAVRDEVRSVPAFDLTFGAPVVYGEAIAIPAEPVGPPRALFAAVRAGIVAVRGDDAVSARSFHPHVSVAYSHVDTDAEPYRRALATIDGAPVTTRVEAVTLIRQERVLAPHRLYRWTTEATASLST